jgi:hypothetical protein
MMQQSYRLGIAVVLFESILGVRVMPERVEGELSYRLTFSDIWRLCTLHHAYHLVQCIKM